MDSDMRLSPPAIPPPETYLLTDVSRTFPPP